MGQASVPRPSLPKTPIVLTVLLAVGALAAPTPLRDAATLAAADRVHLELPPLYVALAPICGVMDGVACLTLTQQVALVVTLGAIIVTWWPSRPRSLLWPRSRLGAVGMFAVGVLAYAEAALLWDRPMAALRADDPDEVIVDFHSTPATPTTGARPSTRSATARGTPWPASTSRTSPTTTPGDAIRTRSMRARAR